MTIMHDSFESVSAASNTCDASGSDFGELQVVELKLEFADNVSCG